MQGFDADVPAACRAASLAFGVVGGMRSVTQTSRGVIFATAR